MKLILGIFSIFLINLFADDKYYLIDSCEEETIFIRSLDARCSYISKLDIKSENNCNIYRIKCDYTMKQIKSVVSKSVIKYNTIDEDKPASVVVKDFDSDTMQKINTRKAALNYNDPKFSKQFTFASDGTLPGTNIGFDMNMLEPHFKGFRGNGRIINVLDDGCDINHPDVASRIITQRTQNFADESLKNFHGTACSSLIAGVANNSMCIVGMAPEARLGILKIIGSGVYESEQATALASNAATTDVYSNSWGPSDDGFLLSNMPSVMRSAIVTGIVNGRNGKGSIYTFANGNGGTDDSCGADGYSGLSYSIAVQAVNEYGEPAYYAESCGSVYVASYIGEDNSPAADLNSGCATTFQGTSAATPIVSGIIALVIEANPNLTWRDVHHIIVRSGKLTHSPNPIWQVNGAGLIFSPTLGFGVLDGSRALRLAQLWTNVGPLCGIIYEYNTGKITKPWYDGYADKNNYNVVNSQADYYTVLNEMNSLPTLAKINWKETTQINLEFSSVGKGTYNIPQQQGRQDLTNQKCTPEIVESMSLEIHMAHFCRGSLTIALVSPSNSTSILLTSRPLDTHASTFTAQFKNVNVMGERLDGTWELKFIDNGECPNSYLSTQESGLRGIVVDVKVTVFATTKADSAYSKNKSLLDPLILSVGKASLETGMSKLLTEEEVISAIEESKALSLTETVAQKSA